MSRDGMNRKECYRLMHPLSIISGYATALRGRKRGKKPRNGGKRKRREGVAGKWEERGRRTYGDNYHRN